MAAKKEETAVETKKEEINGEDVQKTTIDEEITQIAAFKEQLAEMIEQAKAEATKIISDAKAQSENKSTESSMTKEQNDYMEELIEVKLFKDSGKYQDDVFVAVNGESCLIQRGKAVKIKRKFAMALENSAMQDEYSAEYNDQLSDEYKEKENRLS